MNIHTTNYKDIIAPRVVYGLLACRLLFQHEAVCFSKAWPLVLYACGFIHSSINEI